MPHLTLPRTTHGAARSTSARTGAAPARRPRRSTGAPEGQDDSGSFLFLGGVLVVALLAVLVWQGLF